MTREKAKQHIERVRRERFWLDDASRKPGENPLMAMLNRALNQLATGIFEHAHHYVFELTQNADDNNYPDHADRLLKFVLLEDDPTDTPGSRGCLCVLNDETGFEKKHVESLCDIGNSTKQGNREGYIGEKGIGFKSVFLISDRPHVISNGYSFHFRRDDCDAGLGYIVPHWNAQVPAVAENSPTAILLPLRSNSGVDVAKQLADIEPECILFLRRLRSIELVAAKTGLNRTVRCSGADGFFDLDADGTRTSYFVHRADHSCSHIHEPLREGVNSTSVTVALPLTAMETMDGRVFAFLPTEARTGFPFFINADFLLPASRERIFDTPQWNKQLVKFAAGTFVEAFDKLRGRTKHRTLAYCFIPTKADLLPGASLFAPLVDAVQFVLKEKECVLTETGDFVVPADACFAGPLSRRLLSESPPGLADFRLVHPDLENHRKRLEPLGVQTLTISQVLDICVDGDWLRGRSVEWWETLYELLSRNGVSAEAVASFPLLRCQDGVCRCPSEATVFIQAESEQTPLRLRPEWPAAHIFDAELHNRLQQKAVVWAWLSQAAGLRRFSVQAYVTNSLLDWMLKLEGEQAASQLVVATRFIASHLKSLDEGARKALTERMPWVLADGQVLHPDERENRELVTPESLEDEAGWNWVFNSEHDRQHFCVLADAYVEGQPAPVRSWSRKLMEECGAINFPNPAQRDGHDGGVDWLPPRWLRDLSSEHPPANLSRKLAALERWIGCFKPDYFIDFLTLGEAETQESEFGLVLRTRAWVRTTKGFVSPPSAFVADNEIKDFLGDSVPYIAAELSSEIIGKLGVHLRLSAKALLDLLRQMRDSGQADEALIVRIYRRLQTLEFDTEVFRTEPLIFLARPSAQWMQTGRVFWNDAGDVFDEEFGYAELTYGNEELHRFFTAQLGIREEVSEQQLAEVWAQMSGTEATPPSLVEKRLKKILPILAEAIEPEAPPEWWLPIRRRLKVWTSAGHFEAPRSVFAPDDTLAEELFVKAAPIAWLPKSHLTSRLNRLLRELGCHSLAESLCSRAASPEAVSPSATPQLLTQATKELLVCWVCSADGSRKKHSELEQLLRTQEALVGELRIEYSLEGVEVPPALCEADAFWDSASLRLYLRRDATHRAQQSAAAASLASQFGWPDKQDKDTAQCLLSLEGADAQREMAERKWELTPEQKRWIRGLGLTLEILETSEEVPAQSTREARPAITPQKPSNVSAAATPQQNPASAAQTEGQTKSDAQSASSSADSSQPDDGGAQTDGAQHVERNGPTQQTRPTENEEDSGCPLKSPDAEAEFVHVTAHTRRRPRRERQQRETRDRDSRDQHPMAGITHAKKVEIEDAAMRIVLRQFERVPGLREFKVHDERKRNHGYDVLAIKLGHALRIEIKAHLREAQSVFVTQKEWQQSRQRNGLAADDRWELWNVENLAADAGKIRITRYAYLPDEARTRESGYWVDLNACHSQSVP